MCNLIAEVSLQFGKHSAWLTLTYTPHIQHVYILRGGFSVGKEITSFVNRCVLGYGGGYSSVGLEHQYLDLELLYGH